MKRKFFEKNWKKFEKIAQKMKKNKPEMTLNSLRVLGVGVSSTSEEKALEFLKEKLQKGDKFWIATPNPEMVVKARHEPWFKKLLNSASFSLPDGVGLVWASRALHGNKGLKRRVTGADFMLTFCQEAEKKGWRVFFLGGGLGVAQEALEVLKKQFPKLVGEADEGPQIVIEDGKLKFEKEDENKKVVEKINKFSPDLLFVGFGMGKQEAWIDKFLPKLKVGGAMVVGGSFDYLSGRIRRAPKVFQKANLEWLWRLVQEPWRLKRQLALLEFVYLVAKEKF